MHDEFSTPMMLQYLEIKKNYSDCILLFRLGDFYEMFLDDAKKGAEILDITLTSRDRGKDGRIPMAGIPFHALDSYLSKFIRLGYKVAICEQIGDTKGPGLVEREVVRIITPGTLLNENILEKKENNYISAIHFNPDTFGLAFADISTGSFEVSEYPISQFDQTISNEFAKYCPSECLLAPEYYENPKILQKVIANKKTNVFPYFEWNSATSGSEAKLKAHFNLVNLASFGLLGNTSAVNAACVLLSYLKFTQKKDLTHIKKIEAIHNDSYLALDRSTIYNLELFNSLRDGSRRGTLIDYMDFTLTSAGGRLLRQWMMKPLLNINLINTRLDAVEKMSQTSDFRQNVKSKLSQIMDIERIFTRIAVGIGGPKDIINLAQSLEMAIEIKDLLLNEPLVFYQEVFKGITDSISDLITHIRLNLVDNPPFDPKTGGYIKEGVNAEVDSLRAKVITSKNYLSNLEISEKKRTGIGSLKLRFNQVFGYYIEITKSNLDSVPSNYIRKQTMVNAERFITPELKQHEEIILTAEEKIKELEYKVFLEVVNEIVRKTTEIQDTAHSLAKLDCIYSLGSLAYSEALVRPSINDLDIIDISNGRHPVVEKALPSGEFIPNDTYLNGNDSQLMVVTGPNMAGKSVFIRQVGLLVLMAQMGSFIPVDQASIGLVDKIFVRSGASDFIAGGLSTFMVEMTETAYILNNCTSKSLIIMDEIGRGTSTYDGISIAWSVAEYLVSGNGVYPKTLFATHYHELQTLAELYKDKIKNLQVLIEETPSGPAFLHKVVPGSAQHSYGLEVARLAGVPEGVYSRAATIMNDLKFRANSPHEINSQTEETDKFLQQKKEILAFISRLKKLDISTTTPLEALNVLAELKQIWDRNYHDTEA